MTFKAHEIAYLRESVLGRLATIQPDGTPQNSPVGFSYNEELGTIDIPGYRMSKSQKYRNIAKNDKVAFVVDDVTSRDPWRVRCLEIRGTAEQARLDAPAVGDEAHADMDLAIIRITPKRIISFGVDTPDIEPHELVADIRNV
ncbi:pyridoxamine 5'-phosphate oxidase family protein [Mycolicibacterium rutilum]|uniref:Pyridoxamine 5'-phosphate oxidase family protein n=1 Tax=Mycolicibacterium rutilum TaxID=370526 RepID=A0A1H6JXZ4_MYCRU|nr:PPOX class F420-dependent oxidoreductase [Mycolicibacterium rutilum]SEH67332.1 pyridoxamine 5'-phosphate oxidase family protein [Mycolicibacterium rutilum]